jgi:hypothetical protein
MAPFLKVVIGLLTVTDLGVPAILQHHNPGEAPIHIVYLKMIANLTLENLSLTVKAPEVDRPQRHTCR